METFPPTCGAAKRARRIQLGSVSLIKLTMEMLSSLQCDGGLQDVCYPAAGGAPFGRPLIEQHGDARHTLLGELQKGAVGAWRDFFP